jgi:hypothetical protein
VQQTTHPEQVRRDPGCPCAQPTPGGSSGSVHEGVREQEREFEVVVGTRRDTIHQSRPVGTCSASARRTPAATRASSPAPGRRDVGPRPPEVDARGAERQVV